MKKSCRVYVVTHLDGRMTGILMRTWHGLFDRPPLMLVRMSDVTRLLQAASAGDPRRGRLADLSGATSGI